MLLAWTYSAESLHFLAVRHYAIPELVRGSADGNGGMLEETQFVNDVLAGPKYLAGEEFARVCRAFNRVPEVVRSGLAIADEHVAALVSDMVRVYGVSLVRDRAVMLLDAVEFSLQSPLDQMAMLNSLAFSVNSAYGQLLSKDIQIDFARSTTGDGLPGTRRVDAGTPGRDRLAPGAGHFGLYVRRRTERPGTPS